VFGLVSLNCRLRLLQPRSQGPPSSYLVAAGNVSMYTNQIRTGGTGGGSLLNCVKTVYGGESYFASQTQF